MAKKFFYNRVYNTKRTIINIVIIGVCIIGIIICFILTSNFQGESKKTPGGELSIKKEATVEVNEKFANDIYFSKIENVDLDKIKINYPDNYDISKVGKYDVKIVIDDKSYDSSLNVVDTTKPELTLKELTIKPNATYSANDFVESCTDNSNANCNIAYYAEGVDEEGKAINYENYKKVGSYSIKISATDATGNQTVKETKLIIQNANNPKPSTTQTDTKCKYGNGEYDSENYLIAIDITSNNCAVSLDLYKNANTTKEIDQLMETETTRIKKDVEGLNLAGTLALNRMVSAVANKTGDGIVGYELKIVVKITNNSETKTITEYKVDKDGKRVFIENPYKLEK